jgi:hypothetical protein
MYQVKFKSTGKVAASFMVKDMAVLWYEYNNFDPDSGAMLDLFEIVYIDPQNPAKARKVKAPEHTDIHGLLLEPQQDPKEG